MEEAHHSNLAAVALNESITGKEDEVKLWSDIQQEIPVIVPGREKKKRPNNLHNLLFLL